MNRCWWTRGTSCCECICQSDGSSYTSHHNAIFTFQIKALSIASQRQKRMAQEILIKSSIVMNKIFVINLRVIQWKQTSNLVCKMLISHLIFQKPNDIHNLEWSKIKVIKLCLVKVQKFALCVGQVKFSRPSLITCHHSSWLLTMTDHDQCHSYYCH